jgi:DNA-binding XRE family transcriptional regulator
MAKPRESLRRRRKELGFTQQTMAEQLRVSPTTYRDWERGIAMPRAGFRPRLARYLQMTLVELGRCLDGDGREAAPDGLRVGWLGHFASLEQGAAELWAYEPLVVPGLLQTAEYATEVERSLPWETSEAEVARRVDMRLARQEVLQRDRDPLVLSVVLDEAVLYRVAGDEEVMRWQLHRLTVDAQRPNVVVRIVPFTVGDFCATFGSFTVLRAPEATTPYMDRVQLVLRFRCCGHRSINSSPGPRLLPFGPGIGLYPASYTRPPQEDTDCWSRFPVAFRPPAFASWTILFPPRTSASLTVGLPRPTGRGP